MKMIIKLFGAFLAVAAGSIVSASAQNPQNAEAAEAAYAKTISERSDKIVATLGITNSASEKKVHDVIARQYRDLRDIHAARDAELKAAKAKFADDKAGADAAAKTIQADAKAKMDKLHGEFLARLSTDLSVEQVDKVKDGLTYGVLQVTYNVYLKMYPELTEEQKTQIKAWLVEARELAMDGGSSDEKHAVFGKYKGRINNYLSKAGYDAKKGEANLKNDTQLPTQTKSK
jgi:hypothetical protein